MSCKPEIDPSKVLAGLYSASAREYADLWAPVLRPTTERLIAAMPLTEASIVLDLGTGTGTMLPWLRSARAQRPGDRGGSVDRYAPRGAGARGECTAVAGRA
jgi:hypothetical protein